MRTRLFLLTLFTAFAVGTNAAPPSEEGKTIFNTRCASCHNVNKQLTGPALAGLHERRSIDWIINFHERRSLDWIINFVHSSQSMVKNGDKDAVALFEKFNKIPMPDHPDLTDDNIKSIVEFVKTESKTATETAPFAKPGKLRPNYTPLSISNDYLLFIGFFATVVILVAVLLFAVKASEFNREQKGNEL
jgi:cytochrome c551/c552